MSVPIEEDVLEVPARGNLDTSATMGEHFLYSETESSNHSDHSDGTNSVSSRHNKDIQEETKRREKVERAKARALENLQKAEIKELALVHFHSHAGVIYVADEHWLKLRRFSAPCHIYVSLQALDKAAVQKTLSSALPGFLPDRGPPMSQNNAPGLPPRFRIMNEILLADMSAVRKGLGHPCPYLTPNHVAPFRDIIPFEQSFERRLLETEKAFNEMAEKQPQHPAVLGLECDWVPKTVLTAPSTESLVPVEPLDTTDEIARARLLRDGYRALVYLLGHELGALVQDHRRIQDGTIEKLPFLHLWHLFKAGQEIITHDVNLQVYRVLQVTGGRKLMMNTPDEVFKKPTMSDLVIDCFYLDFNGVEFGPVPKAIRIKPYQGLKPVRQLVAYPLELSTKPNLSQELIDRGLKFFEMVEASHRKYEGPTMKAFEPFDTIEEIDGDVMVDFRLAHRSNEPSLRFNLPRFDGGVIDEPTEENDAEIRDGRITFDDPQGQRETWLQWSRGTDLLEIRLPDTLVEECYKLLPARVWGYVFLRRKWYPLNIDLIQPAQTVSPGSADGFEKLVLPSGHKDIVRALVRTYSKRLGSIDTKSSTSLQREFDLVKGKGKGLIILLHGAPGVGKTSTAECVAANAGKPLFPITIGDVGGESAAQVEQNLEKYFDLARKWNCVLLLDEADVFLGTRVEGNIAQNSLVSVFLRALEYYSGILILTTNRVGSFDEAIKSRVHCALYYPPLDKDQTMKVWQMNLKSLEERNTGSAPGQRIQFEPKEIEEYARHHWKKGKRESRWNGRQIKNAFQTAVALADWDTLTYTSGKGNPEGTVLRRQHFEKVAEASAHFDMYLERTRTSDQQRAREYMYREDNVGSRLNDLSESNEESTSEVEVKNKKKSSKKVSARKSKSSKDKGSKSRKQRKEESDKESTEGSASEKSSS